MSATPILPPPVFLNTDIYSLTAVTSGYELLSSLVLSGEILKPLCILCASDLTADYLLLLDSNYASPSVATNTLYPYMSSSNDMNSFMQLVSTLRLAQL